MYALQCRQLHFGIDAFHFPDLSRMRSADGQALSHRQRDNIGEIILTLGIVIIESAQRTFQERGWHDHDAGIDFLNGALGGAGIFLFDYAQNLPVGVAHNAAIASRVGQRHRQNTQLILTGGLYQSL